MKIKALFTLVLLNISLVSMDKPILQRAISGIKKLISTSNSESLTESSQSSSSTDSEPPLSSSSSSTLSQEDTLRISGFLYKLGVDPVNHYDKALNAILDNNRHDFLNALSKLPEENLELQETLHRYWKIHKEGKEPKSEIVTQAKPENDILLNREILQAAQEMRQEIERTAPLLITPQIKQRHLSLPLLDFSALPHKGSLIPRTLAESDQTTSSASSSPLSSPSKSTVIKTVLISSPDHSDDTHHTKYKKEKAHHCGNTIKKEK